MKTQANKALEAMPMASFIPVTRLTSQAACHHFFVSQDAQAMRNIAKYLLKTAFA